MVEEIDLNNIEKKDLKIASKIASKPKNFLFVSYDSLIGDTARVIKNEGHNVKYWIRSPEDKDIGDGFFEKIDDWRAEVDWADIIIFDDVLGMGLFADEMRAKGKLVVGGSPYTDQLEDDRAFGQEELKKHGISILPYKQFESFEEGIEYVKNNPAKYVIKPSGEAQNLKGLLFIGEEENGSDVVQVLSDYNRAWADKIPVFQLQKRVVGVEVAVGAFFNGNEFVYPINVNFEHKKLFPGNLGPSTGEMGTSMFWSGPNKIFNQTLKKFEEKLAEQKYVGYVDLNCIVNGNGIYPLEFTSRFGYPTIFIQQEGINMPMGDFFYKMASGELKNFKTKSGFQVGVRIVMPPYPFTDNETFEVKSKDTIIHFKKHIDGVHIEDVKLVNGEWVVTGTSGVILVVVGTGLTMKQAQNQVYARIKNIMMPHMYYRTDIGDRWYEDSDKLHNWGYLREV
jgi:phosphoribosylamine---glycine ligase